MTPIRFYRDFEFEYGVLETVSPLVRRIVARNPGSFTGPGTGTYVVGRGQVAVIDPGPSLSSHIDALLHSLRNETVEHILITHTHPDHWPATSAVQRATGARVSAFEAGVGEQSLRDGDIVEGQGWHLEALHTPGHTSDHFAFAMPQERVLFSGDHVMGWSTSVIIPPDGDLGDYMNSLEKVLQRDDAIYLPTHGPAITNPKEHVRAFIRHRQERTEAILRELRAESKTISEIVRGVYTDVSSSLHGAAALSVEAHLIELQRQGQVETDAGGAYGRYRLRGAGRR
jgi:glyoxylase-like metal-dependent hydrolase (beta-lactamase superfamily II)